MYNFVNPYNFVPFGSDNPKTVDKKEAYRGNQRQQELLSGWLDVRMYIKTPLIIPDGAHPGYWDLKRKQIVAKKADVSGRNDYEKGKNLHLEYNFLKAYNPKTGQQEYAVSGSELRGLIRSTYETVTNSCIPFLMNDKPMSQRVPLYGALNRRGLLRYDGERWVLYKTTKELEEVIVIPVYEVRGKYYIESLDKVKHNEENNKLDTNGNLKYPIMACLPTIEESLATYKWNSKQLICGAQFSKNRDNNKKWDIKVGGQVKETQTDKKIVHHIFINAGGTVIEKKTGSYVNKRGWLQYNVPVDTSRVYHIAYLTKGDEEHRWPDSSARGREDRSKEKDMLYAEAYKKLKSALCRDGATGKDHPNRECNEALKAALESACRDDARFVPVYYFPVYDDDKKIVYMSGSAAGRIAQRRKWEEIMQGHTPCGNKLCPACLLFGTIKDDGMKGHVRFTDGFLTAPEQAATSTHTLQVLGAPRTTAFEFYLKKPDENATYWNYDFYGVTEGDGNQDSHTNYYHLAKAMPRGRKMYWHHKPAADDRYKTNLNHTMESLNKGTFTFQIYFDQISKEQLQDLIWTVELGDNQANSKYQHKLGHAKPLGYGSVKLVVDGGKIRRFSNDRAKGNFRFEVRDLSDFHIDVNEIKPSFDPEAEEVKKLLIMANTDTVKDEHVDYPRIERNKQIFEWFAKNRTNAKSLEILPEPDAEELSLGEKEKILKRGDILKVKFDGFAEKRETGHRFGIFVKLPGGESALMFYKQAKKRNLQEYEGTEFQVKIEEIKVERGRKKYSVTDKL